MTRPRTLEEWEDAIGILAQGSLNLEAMVKAQGELLKAMDLRIRTLTALIDNHQTVLIAAGLATPRPSEDPLVN